MVLRKDLHIWSLTVELATFTVSVPTDNIGRRRSRQLPYTVELDFESMISSDASESGGVDCLTR